MGQDVAAEPGLARDKDGNLVLMDDSDDDDDSMDYVSIMYYRCAIYISPALFNDIKPYDIK